MVETAMTGPLTAQIVVERDGFTLDVTIEIGPGQSAALLGPNGAGKSTAVSALAGLTPLDGGRIRLGDRILDDPDDRLFVAPVGRNIGVVFQDYLLFPHLTAAENIGFGLRHSRVGKAPTRKKVETMLDSLGLTDLANRKPHQLSGGEAQRVALGRALITDPDLLLLDEPLSALDASTRVEMRRVLADRLAAFAGPKLFITHDPTEAFLLADQIHIIEDGSITQVGTAEDIRLRPRTRFVADLAGANLLRGTADHGEIVVGGHTLHSADSEPSGKVLATIHPHAIALHRNHPEGSPRNTWQTTVSRVEHFGSRVRVQMGVPLPLTAEVTPAAVEALGITEGSVVWISIKATEISVEPQ
jgi:molybdate transport system ATP-binding protein